ncbi:Putative DNA polymerase [Rhizopus microsporus]|nr:Putative DNA polymerase [Rhizopus microsporus]
MTISIRIVDIDHYLQRPCFLDRTYSPFCDNPLSRVPVIRIFGSTDAGQKACVHIHQIYPYFYVPYTISQGYNLEDIQKSIFQFGTCLNQAFDQSIRPSPDKKNQHIAAIVLVKGIPFYGYHTGYQTFLKIYIIDPSEKQQMIDILQSQAIMGTHFQPFESHIPFELQFLMDHNLHGMDWIHLDTDTVGRHAEIGLRFRLPLVDTPKSEYNKSQVSGSTSMTEVHDKSVYTSETVPVMLQSDALARESHCELEIDATSMCILNRLELIERDIHADLSYEMKLQKHDLLNPDEVAKRKLVKSLETIWKDEAKRRRAKGNTEPLWSVSQTDDQRVPSSVPWTSEPSLRSILNKMIERSGSEAHTNRDLILLNDVMTAFQSVESLYTQEYYQLKRGTTNQHVATPQEKEMNQFSVISDPSRYKAWITQNYVDTNLIDSYLESKAKDDDEEQHFDLDHEEADQQILDDDVFDNNDYGLKESDIAKWIEEFEKREGSSRPVVSIEYEDDDDNIRQGGTMKAQKTSSLSEQVDMISQVGQKRKLGLEENDAQYTEDGPFQISNILPDTTSRPNRFLRKLRISQLDGIKDTDEPTSTAHSISAKEQWEQEKKLLKKMKTRKRKMPENENETIVSVVIKESPVFNRRRKRKQKVSNQQHATTEGKSQKDIPQDGSGSQENSTILSNSHYGVSQSILNNSEPLLSSQQERMTVEHTYKEEVAKGDDSSPGLIDMSDILDKQTLSKFFSSKLNDMWPPKDEQRPKEDFENHVPLHESLPTAQDEPCSAKQLLSISSGSDIVEKQQAAHVTNDIEQDDNVDCDWERYFQRSESASSSRKRAKVTQTAHKPAQMEFVYVHPPPTITEEDLIMKNIPNVIYKEPFYSKSSDVPTYPTSFNGQEFKLKCNTINSLKEFKNRYFHMRQKRDESSKVTIRHWTPTNPPPSFKEVQAWLENEKECKKPKIIYEGSQLDGPSLDGPFDFKYSASKPVTKTTYIESNIDYFSLEIHVNTRADLLPDPEQDAVSVIFYCLKTEDLNVPTNGYQQGYHLGIICLNDFIVTKIGIAATRADIDYAETEEELFSILIEKVRLYDPDMLVGYEVQNSSWGYLIERGARLGINVVDELSRVISHPSNSVCKDDWGYKKASIYKICGRHMLNVWRLMRSELALTSYTLENIAYNLLHERVPHFSHATLTAWYRHGPAVLKYRLFKYYMKRVQMNLDILDVSQVISRTCESARVFGVNFYSVLTRGSQFKVESIMLRISKPENFLMISPSRKQVGSQRSLECLPLIMEPISKFYNSPMAVLDFQSLYPSIIIAYNYCYSTCLGRIRKPGESSRFGILDSFDLPDGLLNSLKDYINISPNGVMFVKPEVRKSLLAKMLQELLDTRIMVKKSMKEHKDDSGLLRSLDAKQLTLKFIANVIYGYTSASFSGRMPSVDIADSIVQTGRETLERAIDLIHSTEKWDAQVVYGDTDSVFVYFPGKTIEEAFALGNEIGNTITKMNPAPIKLKFEKIYHPAVLLAKKRYVGFKYESPEVTEPVFEAKGIETVRRDHTPATQKILESSLKILFRSQDMSELKQYLYRQWTKILLGRVRLQDFIIAKEVRMGTYASRDGPNGAIVAQARMNKDIRSEPQYGERVSYVVVYKDPGAKLKEGVVSPETVLNNRHVKNS